MAFQNKAAIKNTEKNSVHLRYGNKTTTTGGPSGALIGLGEVYAEYTTVHQMQCFS